jgi:hypothetical protein
MTSNEMTQFQPGPLVSEPTYMPVVPLGTQLIQSAVEQMVGAHQLGTALAGTSFVPKHFQGKPDDVTAAIMFGAALGLDPMSAVRSVYVVSGTPGLYARSMVAVAMSKGHKIWTEETTDEAVTVAGQRRGSDVVERVTWTIARAKKAGYTSNAKYSTDPQAMLWARAAGDVARRIAPDALAGLDYSVEELQVIDHVDVSTERPKRESAAALVAPAVEGVAEPRCGCGNPSKPGTEHRIGAPCFTPEPTVDPTPEPEAVEVPMVTKAQLSKIAATMRDLGITERPHALGYIEKAIGLKIASRSELTREEAGRLIDALDEDVAQLPTEATPEPDDAA